MRHTLFTPLAGFARPLMVVVALAAGSAGAADQPLRVPLTAQNNSGESGTVTFTPEGAKTRVEISLSGAPATAQPAHIHEGSCAQIDPKPKYPLDNVIGGRSSTLVAAPLTELTSGRHAVNVHKSASDLATYVACGDLVKR